MRKLTGILAFTTVVFAATTIYLALELQEARKPAALPATPAAVSDAALSETAAARLAKAPEHATSPPAAPPAGTQTQQDSWPPEQRESARKRLAQLTDPTMRAQMYEEWIEANLPQKQQYARYLGISEADAERLLGVLAEQNLALSEAISRCVLQERCDLGVPFREGEAARQQAIADLLGAEKQQRFAQYEYSVPERSMLTPFLRDKIPVADQLSEEQAERLITAFAEERKLVEAEIRQRGVEPTIYPKMGVTFTFPNSVFSDPNADQRLAEAADYNRRMHQRAEAVLTARQLAAFEQMQKEALVALKTDLRSMERDRATARR